MFLFNEYVTYPFVWIFLGIGLGLSHRRFKDIKKYLLTNNIYDLENKNA